MVRIRLSRMGRKNKAFYRIVVTHNREKRESKVIEYVGHYNPHSKEIKLEKELIEKWIKQGAQPSEIVTRILVKEKLIPAPAKKQTFSKKPGKKKTERSKASA